MKKHRESIKEKHHLELMELIDSRIVELCCAHRNLIMNKQFSVAQCIEKRVATLEKAKEGLREYIEYTERVYFA